MHLEVVDWGCTLNLRGRKCHRFQSRSTVLRNTFKSPLLHQIWDPFRGAGLLSLDWSSVTSSMEGGGVTMVSSSSSSSSSSSINRLANVDRHCLLAVSSLHGYVKWVIYGVIVDLWYIEWEETLRRVGGCVAVVIWILLCFPDRTLKHN